MGTAWLINALLTVLLAGRVCVASSQTICNDTTGKEFYVGALQSYDSSMSISLVASSNSTGLVSILAPSIGINSTFTLINGTRTIPINGSIVQTQNATVQDKTIIVSSTVDISLLLITFPSNAYEEVLILPTECLSTRYIVSSYYLNKAYPQYRSNFLVVGTQDNTSVNVTARIGNSSFSHFTFSLDDKQSYLYNTDQDLTGTIIVSDKPIAVFSGLEAIVFTNGDFASEQLIPSSMFGMSFIVPTLYPKSRYFVRIISSESDTQVFYKQATATITRSMTLNASGDFIEIVATEPLRIDAQKPVSVMLYSFDYGDNGDTIGAPFLSTVPAISQYISEYYFTIPDEFSTFVNYISIMTSNDSILADIRLDGNHLPSTESTFNLTVNGSVYFVNTYIVTAGFHRLVQTKQIPFGAILYGYRAYDGYGTALRLHFDKSRLDPSPTPDMLLAAKQVQCYSCNDLSHLYLCNTVTTCKTTETCFVERYEIPGGDIRYNSGCIETKKCTNMTSKDCLECCDGDYCNSKGCSAPGLPPRDSRGPMCYDCLHVSNMTECHTVRLCYPDEVCGIEKFTWGGLYEHYTAGCHRHECTSGKRAVPDCQHCCQDDFCNTECRQTNASPVFIG